MPFHPPKNNARTWLRYAEAHGAETLVYTCRPPTPIERLAAAGYTRRVSDGLVWFESAEGRTTRPGACLDEAVKNALEAIDAN